MSLIFKIRAVPFDSLGEPIAFGHLSYFFKKQISQYPKQQQKNDANLMESWFQIIFLDHDVDVDVDVRKENKRVFTKKKKKI